MTRSLLRRAVLALLVAVPAAAYAYIPGDLEPIFCGPTPEECEDLADSWYDQCVANSNGSSAALRACRNTANDIERACNDDDLPCIDISIP